MPADVTFQSIAAGSNTTCGDTADRQAVCWGYNVNGQATPPDAGRGITTVAEGDRDFTCGLREDGSALCWGAESTASQVPVDAGPFVSLRSSYNRTCGLTPAGRIACWGETIGTTYIPDQVYTDIAVGGQCLNCTLDVAGSFDCSLNGSEDPYNYYFSFVETLQGAPLVSIDSNHRGVLCGLGINGEVYCSDNAIAPPGSIRQAPPAPTLTRAAAYSDTQAELFWMRGSLDGDYDRTGGFEILRDGEVVAFTTNRSSYIDNTLEPGTLYRFTIREVSVFGDRGEVSGAVLVDTGRRDLGNEFGSFTEPNEPYRPTSLTARVYSTSALELFWDRPETDERIGYSIRRDGTFYDYTYGVSYFDDEVSPGTYLYDVIAVSTGGDILGIDSVTVVVGDSSAE